MADAMNKITMPLNATELSKSDFLTDQLVKWCPGCGNYTILSSMAQSMAQSGIKKENVLLISGIGCSSRIPYYMNTYGFHGIHGRAAAIASGAKLANPELCVWMATGDGDCTAIGGNHFIHLVRRNIDINVVLFNNQIYGLTKGQFSPTTPMGSITKSSPFGTIEKPFNPATLLLGAGGTFYARVPDNNAKLLLEALNAAVAHKGTAVVEVLQNCVIFADKTHAQVTSRETRDDNMLVAEHGKPLLFGKNRDKGLRRNGFSLEVVELGKDGVTLDDIVVHDIHAKDTAYHFQLVEMGLPNGPVVAGIIRSVEEPTYEELLEEQIVSTRSASAIRCVDDLLNSGDVFDLS